MKEFSLSMALADYIPVVLFAFSSVILMRNLYTGMNKSSYSLFAAGMIDVISAGFLKATYKLLYALGVCDFTSLNALFFPLQSLGFMLSGAGMAEHILPHRRGNRRKTAYGISAVLVIALFLLIITMGDRKAEEPALFSGTPVFVLLMILGMAFMDAGFCVLSYKAEKKALSLFFIASFMLSLCMGYLSSKNFGKAGMNWLAQTVNTVSQLVFLRGAVMLDKASRDNFHNKEDNA